MTAVDAVIVAAMVMPIPVLGVLCWIFWRAKQREDAEDSADALRQPPPG